MDSLTRRQLLATSTAAVLGSQLPALANKRPLVTFKSAWQDDLDRPWLGAEYWAGPLQDWRVKGGRIECFNAQPGRNVQVLTRQHTGGYGKLKMSVRLGRLDGSPLGAGKGSAGFRIGILGTLGAYLGLRDYRNNLAFSSGLDCGITAQGGLFFGDVKKAELGKINLANVTELRLELSNDGEGKTSEATLLLRATDVTSNQVLGETKLIVPYEKLAGNLALVANFGAPTGQGGGGKKAGKGKGKAELPGPGNGAFWFSDWQMQGSNITDQQGGEFGPLLFNHYSLSHGVMKMSVQLPPLGAEDNQEVTLLLKDKSGSEREAARATIHPQARVAAFRIEGWDDSADVPYRVRYERKKKTGTPAIHVLDGTIRRNPVKEELKVADISCNIHTAFPNKDYVDNVKLLDPDLLAFVGDQFYESTAGFGTTRAPLDSAVMDYLRKWYFHGWTWRELTKNTPSLCLPDDHDVFQGNLWGVGGEAQKTTQEAGGYEMPADWVNVVHRTQSSHHPDPWDKQPCKQGILNYYGPMLYGGVSFAILADRQFKTGPEGKVPPTGDRGDHVTDLDFDIKKADVAGLELLGESQMAFLKAWTQDWKGAQMKAIISQTVFTGMATTHGDPTGVLRADYDANGWPQSPRNAALREIRKAFAFHLAGDQHLPTVVHYGIEGPRDAGVAFAGPAVNVGYPRWWQPTAKVNGRDAKDGLLGDFIDHFGHPMAVLAVKNGALQPRNTTMEHLMDKPSGFGLVTFNTKQRTIRMDCWPFGTAFGKPGAKQFETWPVTVTQMDNYARKPHAQLPAQSLEGVAQPVVQVIEEASGEVLYTLRAASAEFAAPVFAPGRYTVRLSHPETGSSKEVKGIAV